METGFSISAIEYSQLRRTFGRSSHSSARPVAMLNWRIARRRGVEVFALVESYVIGLV